MYGKDAAIEYGFNESEINVGGYDAVMDSMSKASALETMALSMGNNLAYLNKGIMSQMQANPDDTVNFCYTSTKDTNAELVKLADISKYLLGGFNSTNFAS